MHPNPVNQKENGEPRKGLKILTGINRNAMGEKADMKAFIEGKAVGILFQGGPHDSS